MAVLRPTEDQRVALCAWLTANGIDPKSVPLNDSNIRIVERDGQRVILYTEFVRDELTGNILSNPDRPEPITSETSVPCQAEPPSWLRVPGAVE